MNAVLTRIQEIRNTTGVDANTSAVMVRSSSYPSEISGRTNLQPFFPRELAAAMGGGIEKVPEGPVKFEQLIESTASKYGLPTGLLKAVVRKESGFRPDAMSGSGAMGLMQLMPSTAKSLGVTDPYDPAQNLDGGARYLRSQMDRFGDIEKALAAYNAGPGAVTRYGGVPPYTETQNYVKKVLDYSRAYGFEP